MRRHLWLTAAIIVVAVFGIVHFCLEWRAEKQWRRYTADARARGVKLMFTEFALPPVPDEQNFAALPMMQKAFHDRLSMKRWVFGDHPDGEFKLPILTRDGVFYLMRGTGDPLNFEPLVRGEGPKWDDIAESCLRDKFVAKSSGDAVRDVLAATEHFAPEFQQWGEWRQRPRCRFAYDWSNVPGVNDPVLKTFSNAANVFALRMHAHLELGESGAAVTDFLEGLQAYYESCEEPGMESAYHRLSIVKVLLDAAGDGLRRGAWDDPQLAAIQAELGKVQTWDDYRFALASERAVMNSRVEALLKASMGERSRIRETNHPPLPPVGEWIANLTPRRVILEGQLQQNQYFDKLLARVEAANEDVDLDGATPSSSQAQASSVRGGLQSLNTLDRDEFLHAESFTAWQQILLDQARLACALERYRLARGTYPATLTELVPQFIAHLPHDPYARAPYHYQRTDDGTFLLYGVGSNRKDDGGVIVPNLSESEQPDAIWPFAPAPGSRGR